ncbi:MAG: hypothetical protein HQ564_09065 [Candidatus Saganbacteria bacterium]|nr:hypothetical protein [Candidatus Saganbacteria bacterium]
MKITTTKPISKYLAEQGISIPKRTRLFQLVSNFAQDFSRSCHSEGFWIQPSRIETTTLSFFRGSIIGKQLSPIDMAKTFCDRLKETLFAGRQDFTPEKIENLVSETAFLDNLHEWAELEYYERIVSRFEKGNASLFDCIKALRALAKLDPTNPKWVGLLRQEEKKLEVLLQRAVSAVSITPAPLEQQRIWREIKPIIENILKTKYEPDPSFYLVYSRLAGKDDIEAMKQILLNKFHGGRYNFELPWQKIEFIDLFLEHASSQDVLEVIAEIGNKKFAPIYLAHRLKYKEAIPALAKVVKENAPLALCALNTLIDHDGLELLLIWISNKKEGLREFAGEKLVELVLPSDLPLLYQKIEDAPEKAAVAIFAAIRKVADRHNIGDVKKYLGRSEKLACAAAEVIYAHATLEDIALLEEMQGHMFQKIREGAKSAIDRLKGVGNAEEGPGAGKGEGKDQEKEENVPIEVAHELLWEDKRDNPPFALKGLITEEDIISDRWNLRQMLFDPCGRVVLAALDVIRLFSPGDCLENLVEAYKFISKQHNRYADHQAGAKNAIFTVATLADLAVIEKMLADEDERIKTFGIELVSKLRAWQFIPKFKGLTQEDRDDNNAVRERKASAKLTVLEFAREIKDWSQVVEYLLNTNYLQNKKVAERAAEILPEIATIDRLAALKELLDVSDSDRADIPRTAARALEQLLVPRTKEKEEPPISEKPKLKLGYNQDNVPESASKILNGVEGLLNSPRLDNVAAALIIYENLHLSLTDSQMKHLFGIAPKLERSARLRLLRLAVKTKNPKLIPSILEIAEKVGWSGYSWEKEKEAANIAAFENISLIYSKEDLDQVRKELKSKTVANQRVAVAALGRLGESSDLERIEESISNGELSIIARQSYFKLLSLADLPMVRQRFLADFDNIFFAKAFAKLATADDAHIIERMLSYKELKIRAIGIGIAERLSLVQFLPSIRVRLAEHIQGITEPAMRFVNKYGDQSDLSSLSSILGYAIPGNTEAYLKHATEDQLKNADRWLKRTSYSCQPGLVEAGIRLYVKFKRTDALEKIKSWIGSEHIIAVCLKAIVALGLASQEKLFLLEKLSKEAEKNQYKDFPDRDVLAWVEVLVSFFEKSDIEKMRVRILSSDCHKDVRLIYFAVLKKKAPQAALQIARERFNQLMTRSGYIILDDPALFEILGELGDESDLPMLFKQITHYDFKIAKNAAEAFSRVATPLRGGME